MEIPRCGDAHALKMGGPLLGLIAGASAKSTHSWNTKRWKAIRIKGSLRENRP
jgi:hypothetical protein